MTDMENLLAMQAITLIVLVFLCYFLAAFKEEVEEDEKWLSRLILDNRATLVRLENKLDRKEGKA